MYQIITHILVFVLATGPNFAVAETRPSTDPKRVSISPQSGEHAPSNSNRPTSGTTENQKETETTQVDPLFPCAIMPTLPFGSIATTEFKKFLGLLETREKEFITGFDTTKTRYSSTAPSLAELLQKPELVEDKNIIEKFINARASSETDLINFSAHLFRRQREFPHHQAVLIKIRREVDALLKKKWDGFDRWREGKNLRIRPSGYREFYRDLPHYYKFATTIQERNKDALNWFPYSEDNLIDWKSLIDSPETFQPIMHSLKNGHLFYNKGMDNYKHWANRFNIKSVVPNMSYPDLMAVKRELWLHLEREALKESAAFIGDDSIVPDNEEDLERIACSNHIQRLRSLSNAKKAKNQTFEEDIKTIESFLLGSPKLSHLSTRDKRVISNLRPHAILTVLNLIAQSKADPDFAESLRVAILKKGELGIDNLLGFNYPLNEKKLKETLKRFGPDFTKLEGEALRQELFNYLKHIDLREVDPSDKFATRKYVLTPESHKQYNRNALVAAMSLLGLKEKWSESHLPSHIKLDQWQKANASPAYIEELTRLTYPLGEDENLLEKRASDQRKAQMFNDLYFFNRKNRALNNLEGDPKYEVIKEIESLYSQLMRDDDLPLNASEIKELSKLDLDTLKDTILALGKRALKEQDNADIAKRFRMYAFQAPVADWIKSWETLNEPKSETAFKFIDTQHMRGKELEQALSRNQTLAKRAHDELSRLIEESVKASIKERPGTKDEAIPLSLIAKKFGDYYESRHGVNLSDVFEKDNPYSIKTPTLATHSKEEAFHLEQLLGDLAFDAKPGYTLPRTADHIEWQRLRSSQNLSLFRDPKTLSQMPAKEQAQLQEYFEKRAAYLPKLINQLEGQQLLLNPSNEEEKEELQKQMYLVKTLRDELKAIMARRLSTRIPLFITEKDREEIIEKEKDSKKHYSFSTNPDNTVRAPLGTPSVETFTKVLDLLRSNRHTNFKRISLKQLGEYLRRSASTPEELLASSNELVELQAFVDEYAPESEEDKKSEERFINLEEVFSNFLNDLPNAGYLDLKLQAHKAKTWEPRNLRNKLFFNGDKKLCLNIACIHHYISILNEYKLSDAKRVASYLKNDLEQMKLDKPETLALIDYILEEIESRDKRDDFLISFYPHFEAIESGSSIKRANLNLLDSQLDKWIKSPHLASGTSYRPSELTKFNDDDVFSFFVLSQFKANKFKDKRNLTADEKDEKKRLYQLQQTLRTRLATPRSLFAKESTRSEPSYYVEKQKDPNERAQNQIRLFDEISYHDNHYHQAFDKDWNRRMAPIKEAWNSGTPFMVEGLSGINDYIEAAAQLNEYDLGSRINLELDFSKEATEEEKRGKSYVRPSDLDFRKWTKEELLKARASIIWRLERLGKERKIDTPEGVEADRLRQLRKFALLNALRWIDIEFIRPEYKFLQESGYRNSDSSILPELKELYPKTFSDIREYAAIAPLSKEEDEALQSQFDKVRSQVRTGASDENVYVPVESSYNYSQFNPADKKVLPGTSYDRSYLFFPYKQRVFDRTLDDLMDNRIELGISSGLLSPFKEYEETFDNRPSKEYLQITTPKDEHRRRWLLENYLRLSKSHKEEPLKEGDLEIFEAVTQKLRDSEPSNRINLNDSQFGEEAEACEGKYDDIRKATAPLQDLYVRLGFYKTTQWDEDRKPKDYYLFADDVMAKRLRRDREFDEEQFRRGFNYRRKFDSKAYTLYCKLPPSDILRLHHMAYAISELDTERKKDAHELFLPLLLRPDSKQIRDLSKQLDKSFHRAAESGNMTEYLFEQVVQKVEEYAKEVQAGTAKGPLTLGEKEQFALLTLGQASGLRKFYSDISTLDEKTASKIMAGNWLAEEMQNLMEMARWEGLKRFHKKESEKQESREFEKLSEEEKAKITEGFQKAIILTHFKDLDPNKFDINEDPDRIPEILALLQSLSSERYHRERTDGLWKEVFGKYYSSKGIEELRNEADLILQEQIDGVKVDAITARDQVRAFTKEKYACIRKLRSTQQRQNAVESLIESYEKSIKDIEEKEGVIEFSQKALIETFKKQLNFAKNELSTTKRKVEEYENCIKTKKGAEVRLARIISDKLTERSQAISEQAGKNKKKEEELLRSQAINFMLTGEELSIEALQKKLEAIIQDEAISRGLDDIPKVHDYLKSILKEKDPLGVKDGRFLGNFDAVRVEEARRELELLVTSIAEHHRKIDAMKTLKFGETAEKEPSAERLETKKEILETGRLAEQIAMDNGWVPERKTLEDEKGQFAPFSKEDAHIEIDQALEENIAKIRHFHSLNDTAKHISKVILEEAEILRRRDIDSGLYDESFTSEVDEADTFYQYTKRARENPAVKTLLEDWRKKLSEHHLDYHKAMGLLGKYTTEFGTPEGKRVPDGNFGLTSDIEKKAQCKKDINEVETGYGFKWDGNVAHITERTRLWGVGNQFFRFKGRYGNVHNETANVKDPHVIEHLVTTKDARTGRTFKDWKALGTIGNKDAEETKVYAAITNRLRSLLDRLKVCSQAEEADPWEEFKNALYKRQESPEIAMSSLFPLQDHDTTHPLYHSGPDLSAIRIRDVVVGDKKKELIEFVDLGYARHRALTLTKGVERALQDAGRQEKSVDQNSAGFLNKAWMDLYENQMVSWLQDKAHPWGGRKSDRRVREEEKTRIAYYRNRALALAQELENYGVLKVSTEDLERGKANKTVARHLGTTVGLLEELPKKFSSMRDSEIERIEDAAEKLARELHLASPRISRSNLNYNFKDKREDYKTFEDYIYPNVSNNIPLRNDDWGIKRKSFNKGVESLHKKAAQVRENLLDFKDKLSTARALSSSSYKKKAMDSKEKLEKSLRELSSMLSMDLGSIGLQWGYPKEHYEKLASNVKEFVDALSEEGKEPQDHLAVQASARSELLQNEVKNLAYSHRQSENYRQLDYEAYARERNWTLATEAITWSAAFALAPFTAGGSVYVKGAITAGRVTKTARTLHYLGRAAQWSRKISMGMKMSVGGQILGEGVGYWSGDAPQTGQMIDGEVNTYKMAAIFAGQDIFLGGLTHLRFANSIFKGLQTVEPWARMPAMFGSAFAADYAIYGDAQHAFENGAIMSLYALPLERLLARIPLLSKLGPKLQYGVGYGVDFGYNLIVDAGAANYQYWKAKSEAEKNGTEVPNYSEFIYKFIAESIPMNIIFARTTAQQLRPAIARRTLLNIPDGMKYDEFVAKFPNGEADIQFALRALSYSDLKQLKEKASNTEAADKMLDAISAQLGTTRTLVDRVLDQHVGQPITSNPKTWIGLDNNKIYMDANDVYVPHSARFGSSGHNLQGRASTLLWKHLPFPQKYKDALFDAEGNVHQQGFGNVSFKRNMADTIRKEIDEHIARGDHEKALEAITLLHSDLPEFSGKVLEYDLAGGLINGKVGELEGRTAQQQAAKNRVRFYAMRMDIPEQDVPRKVKIFLENYQPKPGEKFDDAIMRVFDYSRTAKGEIRNENLGNLMAIGGLKYDHLKQIFTREAIRDTLANMHFSEVIALRNRMFSTNAEEAQDAKRMLQALLGVRAHRNNEKYPVDYYLLNEKYNGPDGNRALAEIVDRRGEKLRTGKIPDVQVSTLTTKSGFGNRLDPESVNYLRRTAEEYGIGKAELAGYIRYVEMQKKNGTMADFTIGEMVGEYRNWATRYRANFTLGKLSKEHEDRFTDNRWLYGTFRPSEIDQTNAKHRDIVQTLANRHNIRAADLWQEIMAEKRNPLVNPRSEFTIDELAGSIRIERERQYGAESYSIPRDF